MPTIIDSLIIELGLDPTKFRKGQRDASEAFSKTKDEAVKAGQSIEDASKRAADQIGRLAREALTLFAVFTSGRSIKNFLADIQASDAALGRLAGNMKTTPQALSGWGSILERMGGSASGAGAAFQQLSNAIQQVKVEGQSPILAPLTRLQGLTGVHFDFKKQIDEQFVDISEALSRLKAKDPALANFLGNQVTGNQEFTNALLRGPRAIRQMLEDYRRYAPSARDISAAQELQDSWAQMTQRAEAFGRTLSTSLEPYIVQILTEMQRWVDKNQDWLRSEITQDVRALGDAIKSIDWTKVTDGLGDIEDTAKSIRTFFRGVGEDIKNVVDLIESFNEKFQWLADLLNGLNSLGQSSGKGLRSFFQMRGSAPDVDEYGRSNPSNPSPATPSSGARPSGKQNERRDDDLKVNGSKISSANPVPVTITREPETGGFWSNLWSGVKNVFGAGSGGPGPDTPGSRIGSMHDRSEPGGGDNRTWLERNAPSWLGGKDAPHRRFTRHGMRGGPSDGEAGGSAGPVSGSLRDRGLAAMDRLVKVHGWKPEAAAIAVGNAQQESSVRPDGRPGDHGSAHGMFQWRNERFQALKDFASARNKSWQDFDTQVDFFNEERQRRGALERRWHQMGDLSQAGRVGWEFERYGDQSTGSRVANAQQWLRLYRAKEYEGQRVGDRPLPSMTREQQAPQTIKPTLGLMSMVPNRADKGLLDQPDQFDKVPSFLRSDLWKGASPEGRADISRMSMGAQDVAHIANDNRETHSTSTSTSQTNVNGPITIHTQADDAPGIAAALKPSLENYSFASAVNSGPM